MRATPPGPRVRRRRLELRRLAGADCDAERWDDCLAHLDEARALDPAGDEAPAVKQLRDAAIPGILKKPRPPRH
ncbi:MAG TPA: hypothetical protein VGL81_00010 [Polyangiaceae bacterium]|jgi:hypothetical protein